MFDKFLELATCLFFPIRFMSLAASYIPGTILSLLVDSEFRTLLSPSRFKEAWFARFWSKYGPLVREGNSPRVSPLLKLAHGVVLDIGPGSGEWLPHFDPSKITKIYGIEPNVGHHARLRERISEVGLSSKYIIAPVGVEDLDEWMKNEDDWHGADSIITVLCLCSIPQAEGIIKGLYGCLKQGGCWIVHEHVKAKEGRWIGWYQYSVNFIWPHFIGGCSITKDTEALLKRAGPWSKVDLSQPEGESEYSALPHVRGTLVK
ncbi:hypothetical protein HYALB_00013218 [Hymenoscyphus albidus]|uniref:Methyltransferase domain-containing protein n=1 Tax=Hymenoscyphus albidus TaxID=595503 RepID=A0A9N9LRN6_9HELO|nr:hypothetical protein HYALB_00013218 [Hymenoscyphus albidus]